MSVSVSSPLQFRVLFGQSLHHLLQSLSLFPLVLQQLHQLVAVSLSGFQVVGTRLKTRLSK